MCFTRSSNAVMTHSKRFMVFLNQNSQNKHRHECPVTRIQPFASREETHIEAIERDNNGCHCKKQTPKSIQQPNHQMHLEDTPSHSQTPKASAHHREDDDREVEPSWMSDVGTVSRNEPRLQESHDQEVDEEDDDVSQQVVAEDVHQD